MPEDYTHLLYCPRKTALKLLPRHAVVAEIGVAEGDFSRQILDIAAPGQLHLVDPWEHQAVEGYERDPANVAAAQQETRYRQVERRFAKEIAAEQVILHRAYSTEAAKKFPKGFFDWIYVDAMHTYEAVLADLRAYVDLVKDDGLICGHDYANHPQAQWMNFGVIEAVNRFVEETGCRFVALTDEAYPTYILAKNPGSAGRRALEDAILRNLGFLKVYDFPRRRFQQEALVKQNGEMVRVFGAIR